MKSPTPLNLQLCPLCQGPNGCAMAVPGAGGNATLDCWCNRVELDPAVLAKVPPLLQNKVCICAKCGKISDILDSK